MAQPPAYLRQYDFSDFQSIFPDEPLPGNQVDIELNAIKTFIDAMRQNIAIIQKDDGSLVNNTVGIDQAKTDLIALINGGVSIKGNWDTPTAYSVGDLIKGPDGATYIATTAHTSGVFDTDKDTNNYWFLFANPFRFKGIPLFDAFDGDSTTTDFTLSQSVSSEEQVMVFVDGNFQDYNNFTINDTNISFSTAPTSGTRNVLVLGIDTPILQSASEAEASATDAQTAQLAAEAAQTVVETAETVAVAAQTAAETAKTGAEAARDEAEAIADGIGFVDFVTVTNADTPVALTSADSGKMYLADTSGGAIEFTLPAIADVTEPFILGFKKTTGDLNSVTLTPAAATTDTIDDNPNKKFGSIGGTSLRADSGQSPDDWESADFGATFGEQKVESFVAGTDFTAGTSTTITLTETPIARSTSGLDIFFDGIKQFSDAWGYNSVTGVVTFTSAIPSSVSKIEARWGTALSVGEAAALASSLIASQVQAEAGTDNSQVMTPLRTKQAIDALEEKPLGVGQTWTDVTASRAFNTTYTNSTGRTIFVTACGSPMNSTDNLQLIIDGVTTNRIRNDDSANMQLSVSGPVPDGATYEVSLIGSAALLNWVELR